MPDLPFPISAKTLDELIRQTAKLFDDMYQDRIGGAVLGDVFEIDAADTLSLKLSSTGGLEKSSSEIQVKPSASGGLATNANGVYAKCKSSGGISTDANGIYALLKANNGLDADSSGLYIKLKTSGGISVDSNGLYLTASESQRGTFDNTSLSTGVLTITHNKALSAPYPVSVTIFNNLGVQVTPDSVTGSTNSVAVDLTTLAPLTGTWGYLVV